MTINSSLCIEKNYTFERNTIYQKKNKMSLLLKHEFFILKNKLYQCSVTGNRREKKNNDENAMLAATE